MTALWQQYTLKGGSARDTSSCGNHGYRRSYLVSAKFGGKILDQIQLLMSSNEDDYNDGDSLSTQSLKKRRIQRACDICRRKKSMSNSVIIEFFSYVVMLSSSMSVLFHQSHGQVLHSYLSSSGDGVQMPGNRCSNCISYSLDCAYVEASKVWFLSPQGPPNDSSVLRNGGHQKGECNEM